MPRDDLRTFEALILYYTSWADGRCSGLCNIKILCVCPPPPPGAPPTFLTPPRPVPGRPRPYLQSFSSVSCTLCECIETDRDRQTDRQTERDREKDNPLYRYR